MPAPGGGLGPGLLPLGTPGGTVLALGCSRGGRSQPHGWLDEPPEMLRAQVPSPCKGWKGKKSPQSRAGVTIRGWCPPGATLAAGVAGGQVCSPGEAPHYPSLTGQGRGCRSQELVRAPRGQPRHAGTAPARPGFRDVGWPRLLRGTQCPHRGWAWPGVTPSTAFGGAEVPGSVPPRSTRGCFPSCWQSSAPGMLHRRNLGRSLGAAVPSSHQPLQAPCLAPGESPGLPNPQPCCSRPRHHGEIIFPQPRRQRSFGQGFLHTSVPWCLGTPLGAAVRMCPSVCPAPCPCTGSRNQQRVADGRSRPTADGARACPENPPDPSCSLGSRPMLVHPQEQASSLGAALPKMPSRDEPQPAPGLC